MRDVVIKRPNQVWSTDITYLRMSHGFMDWCSRYGQTNDHNGAVPRDFWLDDWEKQAIIEFYQDHQQDGYRRLTFMMLDCGVVAVSPSSTYRVLKEAGLMRKWNGKESKKGTGFVQPIGPHEHWHVDVSYLNIAGTLCGMTHVKTSPFYPQSNGKIERFHKSYKMECVRPKTPLSMEDAIRETE